MILPGDKVNKFNNKCEIYDGRYICWSQSPRVQDQFMETHHKSKHEGNKAFSCWKHTQKIKSQTNIFLAKLGLN